MEENNIIMCHFHPLNETCVSFQRMLRPHDTKAASRQIRSQTRKLSLRPGKMRKSRLTEERESHNDLMGVDLKCIKCSMERISALNMESRLVELASNEEREKEKSRISG